MLAPKEMKKILLSLTLLLSGVLLWAGTPEKMKTLINEYRHQDGFDTISIGPLGMSLTAGEPLQYVIGQWDFRDFTLKTDRRALVPRPETETLVDLVLSSPRLRALEAPRIVGRTWKQRLSLKTGTASPTLLSSTAAGLFSPTARRRARVCSPFRLSLHSQRASSRFQSLTRLSRQSERTRRSLSISSS